MVVELPIAVPVISPVDHALPMTDPYVYVFCSVWIDSELFMNSIWASAVSPDMSVAAIIGCISMIAMIAIAIGLLMDPSISTLQPFWISFQ